MPVGDAYEVSLKARLQNQEIANVFNYGQIGGTDNADNLGDLFEADIIPRIRAITSNDVDFYQLDVKNLDDPADFHSRSLSVSGQRTGEVMPSFVAWSITLLTNRTDAKSGGKRFAGCVEGDVVNGIISPGILLSVASLVVKLGQNLASGGGIWRPAVFGRRTGQLGLFANYLSGCNLFGVTTQRSRIFYK